jgi:hypothetical protein
MKDFKLFRTAVGKQFDAMSRAGKLFVVEYDRDVLWDVYLKSFPEGSNPLYKTRTEHDCSCCRHFIKTLGGVVAIDEIGDRVTIWDGPVYDEAYQAVSRAMSAYVRTRPIENIFLHAEPSVGVAKNFQQLVDGVAEWEHFHVRLPADVVVKDPGSKLGDAKTTFEVFSRAVKELTDDSVETVLDLIAQGSLYRGEEHANALNTFKAFKADAAESDVRCWKLSQILIPAVTRIRNTAIGSLLIDLSEGVELEDAVKKFEAKVAPTNYKRPTALVSKAMVAKAQKQIEALGLTSALERRYATIDDLTVNNVLFADRTAKKAPNVFDEVSAGVPERELSKIEEIPITAFLERVLPTAKTLEVLFENRHAGSLVSLIAPGDPTAARLFKWGNPFSWSYAGEVADSIKERVKRAGGNVTGDFRASLSWFNFDDLDLHLLEPDGNRIFFGSNRSYKTNGCLDVDMNAGSGQTRTPVENIVYPKRVKMCEGSYKLFVNQYFRRDMKDDGFEVELEFDGVVHQFTHAGALRTGETVTVARFDYSHKGGIRITESLPRSSASKIVWGLPTQTFVKVTALLPSPNHWEGEQAIGNKHWFFMLDGCKNEDRARGFYNEFLLSELDPHRKVMELVGAKVRTEAGDRQLSGLGFSSTQRASLIVRVGGTFTRTLRVLF